MKCEVNGCLSSAEYGTKRCVAHGASKPGIAQPVEPVSAVVDLEEVPANRRFNSTAMKWLAAVKELPAGKALRVAANRLDKGTALALKRYALEQGLRVGIRLTEEYTFVWKMTEAELAKFQKRAKAMIKANGASK